MPVRQSRFETPLGAMIVIAGPAGIRLIDFHDRRNIGRAVERALSMKAGAGDADPFDSLAPLDPQTLLDQARVQMGEYFAGRRTAFDLPLSPPGSAFQRSVWDALLAIPYGHTRTYSQQARSIGPITALRAVANANGQNFCSVVIPCHRVIGASGELRGYGGGLERKQWLLDHEQSHAAGGTGRVASSLFALESPEQAIAG